MSLQQEIIRFVQELAISRTLLGNQGATRWAAGAIRALPTVLRTRSLAPADRAIGSQFKVHCLSTVFHMTDGDFGICREIIGHDCYRLRPLLGTLRTAIDLGSNCGVFTLAAAAFNPFCRIVAVEANPELAAVTVANMTANGFGGRVSVRNQLVGAPTVASIKALVAASPAMRLFNPNDAIRELGGCDFLKCDVEGAEHVLFSGDLSWLASVKRFAIEYHWSETDGIKLEKILASAGFRVERVPHRTLGYLYGVNHNL